MNRISVVPLERNLLKCVAEDIVAKHHSPDDPLALAGVTVVVPHRRGIIYLRHYLAEMIAGGKVDRRRPILLPRLVTVEDFVGDLAIAAEERPGRALEPADQAWLLFGLVKQLGTYGGIGGSWDRFFGWGVRLAGLIDEIDREMIDPKDIQYPEGVPPEARDLLATLKDIYERFTATLTESGFTTSGKRFRRAAEGAGAAGEAQTATGAARPTYLVGLYAMSRSEDRIFRRLFDAGATVYWHADASRLPPLYQRWKDQWRVDLAVVGENAEPPAAAGPRLYFNEAYDLHAQLRAVEGILAEEVGHPDQCALVLPDPSALVPALYHIPATTEVNISIGYPLERSSIAALLDLVMRLEEGKDKAGAFYYQDYLAVIRHPYVRRLPTPGAKNGRLVLHLLEEKARQYGRPYLAEADLRNLVAMSCSQDRDRNLLAGEGIDLDEALAHVEQLHDGLVRPWQKARTPKDLAATLRRAIAFLTAPFADAPMVREEQVLDYEFLHALVDKVIPDLEDTLFASQAMSRGLLFALLRDLIHITRVPFEGQPLKGLQILGLLETRLLSFGKVIMIDVNEGVVPAHEDVNPLLPEPLRPAVGLPSKEKEEAITRYHFERLVGSAGEVHLLWQASTSTSASGLEGKKTRSRFVEALLWNREAQAGRLLDDTIRRETLRIPPQALIKHEGLAKTGGDAARIAAYLRQHAAEHGISATLLNRYLRCPVRFFYEYILELAVPESPLEEIDSAELGITVHKALEAYFRPFEGQQFVRTRDADPQQLVSLFGEFYRQSAIHRSLGPEKRVFLETAVLHRLRSYLDAMPDETTIESLERRYSTVVPTSLGPLQFGGKVDRIDSREGKRIILDYKTGSVDTFNVGHFEKVLAGMALPAGHDYEGLKQVRAALADLQLPLYVMLVAASEQAGCLKTGRGEEAGEAKAGGGAPPCAASDILSAYVELRAPGADGHKERYFIRPDKAEEIGESYGAWFAETFPRLLAYLIDHMVKSPCFYRATDEAECGHCDYEAICSLAFA